MGHEDLPTEEIEAGRGDRTTVGLGEAPPIASGRRLGGRYLLQRRLGHGGMAVVWLATDERLGRLVAIKVLSDTLTAERDYLGRFEREARVAAGLQHPNLVAVYDYNAGPRPYLVMEYVEGGDLADRLKRDEPPATEQLARELLSALSHIHAAGVLHRDIKPQNVLLDRHGSARLSDFGIARPRDATSLTRTGEVIGTERYLAPEVRAGEPASERSDLYALGVVLAQAAREGGRAGLWKLADQLREPDPERRPASAAAALAELEQGEAGPPGGEATQRYPIDPESPPAAPPAPASVRFEPTPTGVRTPTSTRPRDRRWLDRRRRVVVALGVMLIGGSGGGNDPGPAAGADRGTATERGSARGPRRQWRERRRWIPRAERAVRAADSERAAERHQTVAEVSAAPPAGDGAALNDEGFALVGAGRYEEAVPVLERAVAELRGSGDEATYNYALYNLASAYLGAGRAAEAIPLLEERMRFDDGQLDEVEATLDARSRGGR